MHTLTKIKYKLKSLFSKNKDYYRLQSKCIDFPIKFAFSLGGKNYFEFEDQHNGPILRQMSAIDVWTEFEQKVDSEYLKAFNETIQEVKNRYREEIKKKFNEKDFAEILNLYELQQKEETKFMKFLELSNLHLTNIDLIYKLASVRYFSVDENPMQFNTDVMFDKIESWRKALGYSVDAEINFFLTLPFKELLPSLDGSDITIQAYTEAQRVEAKRIYQLILRVLSESNKDSDSMKYITSQLEILKRYELSKGTV